MRILILTFLLPTLLLAQEFTFRQEYDTIPVEIDGWQPFVPWMGGITMSTPGLCDIDADGDLDFFYASLSGTVALLENNGTAFSADFQFITYQMEPFEPTADISFPDIDNDGDIDILFGYKCYFNIGTPSQYNFQAPFDTLRDTSGNILICPRMATVDINADGDYDIFAGQMSSGQIRFYKNIGTP